MSRPKIESRLPSRRKFLKSLGLAPLLLRPAPFYASPSFMSLLTGPPGQTNPFPFSDIRFTPHYPAASPLADVLRLVAPGFDEFITEKYALDIGLILKEWSKGLTATVQDYSSLARSFDPAMVASTLRSTGKSNLRRTMNGKPDKGIDVVRRQFSIETVPGSESFLQNLKAWLGTTARVETAEFEIVSIEVLTQTPLAVRLDIRYDVVSTLKSTENIDMSQSRQERIGIWRTEWFHDASEAWKVRRWEATEETVSTASAPVFVDVTAQALGGTDSYKNHLLRGSDYWRTVLDGACGIDVYGNNGVAAGDFDDDGFDDLYVCQASGLPNRLYRNKGDGTFEDVTEKAGVGVLDNTSCALFVDFRNTGLQDLLVVGAAGPLLFLNQGNGTFRLKSDAFKFDRQPQGSFTHAAVADYDGDGRLDIYFCLYSYYLGLDQYHYPVPYFDARNGPPNFLLHNNGDGTFTDRTEAAGLNVDNDRYSFACAWGHATPGELPDLYIANDFGRANLYRNNGHGKFTSVATEAHVEDAGAGMSAAWSDIDNDGKSDIYVADMWSSAGQRVSEQPQFHAKSPDEIRALYHRHARGNALYRNLGDGKFENVSRRSGVEMGRWSWSSDFWDFDHDGYSDLYIANGYISAPGGNEAPQTGTPRLDLGSFFWRQVVAKSPDDSTPSLAYERGWQALNELIRSDTSWSGYERNVLYANNRDGSFSEVSGTAGLDFPEDSRSFALADIDHDGRLEVILKNRNAPQLRILHNQMQVIGRSISFSLRGTRSNRDAIGTAITVETGSLRQTKYLQAGSGFLAQHSKEVFFGLGEPSGPIRVTLLWPSGLTQTFENLPQDHQVKIEEGAANFTARPFSARPASYDKPVPHSQLESIPTQAETWLIEPLRAPEFSLPDLAGNLHELQNLKGRFVLLTFWASTAPVSLDLLNLLNQHRSSLAGSRLEILAINIDEEADLSKAKSFAAQARLSFPLLFATPEVAGIYNIIFRYMFDRRRDLGIPTSFLLDQEGMIVKVYQGQMLAEKLAADVKSIPTNGADRLKKALPMPGILCQDVFQRNEFTYGVAMFQHGYLDQAAKSFQQVVAAKPDDAEGYYNLGTLSLRRNDFAQARSYLEKTLQLRPNYPEAWNNLGMMAAQQGHPDEAIQSFQQSIQLRPGYAIALLNLGNVYRQQKDYPKAQESLSQAIALQPDDPEINFSLGMLYAQQNQAQQAAEYLLRAIELRPDYAEARNNLGILYVRSQQYAKAEEQFKACVEVAPSFDQSYLNLARIYAMQGDKEKARAAVQQLLTLQPENPSARQMMEMLH